MLKQGLEEAKAERAAQKTIQDMQKIVERDQARIAQLEQQVESFRLWSLSQSQYTREPAEKQDGQPDLISDATPLIKPKVQPSNPVSPDRGRDVLMQDSLLGSESDYTPIRPKHQEELGFR